MSLIVLGAIACLIQGFIPLVGAQYGSCVSASDVFSSTDHDMMCRDVVTYTFYVPEGSSVADLNSEAIDRVSSLVSVLPTTCQAEIRKMICGTLFNPCIDGVDITNPTGGGWTIVYEDGALAAIIPYVRPCKELCTNTTSAGTSCAGLLELLGAAPDCDITIEGTFANYSVYSEDDTCNSVPGASMSVGSMKESYVVSDGVCSEVVSEFYVPPGPEVSSSLAPLQFPYVIQYALEAAVARTIKVYWENECLAAATKVICATAFMPFEYQSSVAALSSLLDPVYLPQYPHHDLCVGFNDKCESFIEFAKTKGIDAALNCSKVNDAGVASYPMNTQAVIDVSILVVDLTLYTDPNSLVNVTVSATTQCPKGFGVPGKGPHGRLLEVVGTGCAVRCLLPAFTEGEHEFMDRLAFVFACLSLPMGLFFTLTWWVFRVKHNQRLVFWFLIIVTIMAAMNFVIVIYDMRAVKNSEYAYSSSYRCASDVSSRLQDGVNACTVQSVVSFYCALSGTALWFCQAVDVFLRVIYDHRGVNYFRWYALMSFGLPVVLTIYNGVNRHFGFPSAATFCFWNSEAPYWVTWGTFYGWTFAWVVGGFLCMCAVFHKLYVVEISVSQRNALLQLPIRFVVMFLFHWSIPFVVEFYNQTYRPEHEDVLVEWTGCVFLNYFGGGSSDAYEKCGSHPKSRPSLILLNLLTLVFYLPAALTFVIYGLDMENFRLWNHVVRLKTWDEIRGGSASRSVQMSMPSHQQSFAAPGQQSFFRRLAQRFTSNGVSRVAASS